VPSAVWLLPAPLPPLDRPRLAGRWGRRGDRHPGGSFSALWKALHKADYAKPAIMESSRGGCSQEAGRRRLGSGWHPRELDI